MSIPLPSHAVICRAASAYLRAAADLEAANGLATVGAAAGQVNAEHARKAHAHCQVVADIALKDLLVAIKGELQKPAGAPAPGGGL